MTVSFVQVKDPVITFDEDKTFQVYRAYLQLQAVEVIEASDVKCWFKNK